MRAARERRRRERAQRGRALSETLARTTLETAKALGDGGREITQGMSAKSAEIGEAEWQDLRDALAPVSEGYLRRLLRESGAKLAPLVEGIRQ